MSLETAYVGTGVRVIRAVHGPRKIEPDPEFEFDMAAHRSGQLSPQQLLEGFKDHANGSGFIDSTMPKIRLRALAKKLEAGAKVGKNVSIIHLETADGVFIGERTIIHSRTL
jgi:hypothetical protein